MVGCNYCEKAVKEYEEYLKTGGDPQHYCIKCPHANC